MNDTRYETCYVTRYETGYATRAVTAPIPNQYHYLLPAPCAVHARARRNGDDPR